MIEFYDRHSNTDVTVCVNAAAVLTVKESVTGGHI